MAVRNNIKSMQFAGFAQRDRNAWRAAWTTRLVRCEHEGARDHLKMWTFCPVHHGSQSASIMYLWCHKQQHYITHIYTQTHAVWENKQCGTISLRSVDTMSYKTQQASNSGHQDSQSMLRMYLRCQTQQHHHKIHTHTKHTPRGEINNVGQYHCDSFTTQRASNSGWKRTKKGVGLDNGELGSWQIWCVYCLV